MESCPDTSVKQKTPKRSLLVPSKQWAEPLATSGDCAPIDIKKKGF